MHDIHREVGRDPESNRLWELEVLEDKIVGCAGPFRDVAALPSPFEPVAFERNTELLRWLTHRHLQRVSSGPSDLGFPRAK